MFVSSSSLLEMVSKSFPQAYRVVSSAKLQISVSFIKRSKSSIKTLKRIGPSIDPCGTPKIISNIQLRMSQYGGGGRAKKPPALKSVTHILQ